MNKKTAEQANRNWSPTVDTRFSQNWSAKHPNYLVANNKLTHEYRFILIKFCVNVITNSMQQ